jgi:hypothetical protein
MTKTKLKAINILKELPEQTAKSALVYLEFLNQKRTQELMPSPSEIKKFKKTLSEMKKGNYYTIDEV